MQCDPLLRYDWIEFEKMPQKIGTQVNPFTYLPVTPNRSSAHLRRIGAEAGKNSTPPSVPLRRGAATAPSDGTCRRTAKSASLPRWTPDDARQHTRDTDGAKKADPWRAKELPTSLPGRDTANSISSSRQIRNCGSCSTSAGWRSEGRAPPPTSASCSRLLLPRAGKLRDSDISHYGPGALHLRELMAHAIGMGLRRFDFTIGDEPYKLEWSDTTSLNSTTSALPRPGAACRREPLQWYGAA